MTYNVVRDFTTALLDIYC